MRSSRVLLLLALAFGLQLASPMLAVGPQTAWAQDDDDDDDDDDEFETMWFGARVGIWYRPEIAMDVRAGGNFGTSTLVPREFDIERDLGVTQNVTSQAADFLDNSIVELELFFESEWISVFVQIVPPFAYEGESTLRRTIDFGGLSFTATTDVKSTFRQAYGGFDIELNALNTRFVRVSPLVAVRALAVDWEIEESLTNTRADTSDIDSPFAVGDFQVFPYPEVGVDVRVGYRDYIDVGLKVAGSYLSYYGVEGSTARVELTATAYPIPWIGIQAGVRYLYYDIGSVTDDPDERYDFDLEYTGFLFGVIVRI